MFSFFVIRNKNSLKPNEKMKEEKGGEKRERDKSLGSKKN
jgi:hypothetical protein